MFTACFGARLFLQSYQYPNLSEGADRVAGQLRGDKEYLFQWRNQIWQSVEEGAGKRCSECDHGLVSLTEVCDPLSISHATTGCTVRLEVILTSPQTDVTGQDTRGSYRGLQHTCTISCQGKPQTVTSSSSNGSFDVDFRLAPCASDSDLTQVVHSHLKSHVP